MFDVALVNLLYKEQEGNPEMITRSYARSGRLVAHPSGLKMAFPEMHGEGYVVYLLDEPWRKDFIIDKSTTTGHAARLATSATTFGCKHGVVLSWKRSSWIIEGVV